MDIANLKTDGFVSIKYPKELRDIVEKTEVSWRNFCNLPLEKKKLFLYSNKSAGVGYEIKDGSGNKGDIKENFDIALSGIEFLKSIVDNDDSLTAAKIFIDDAMKLVVVMTSFINSFAEACEKTFNMENFAKEIKDGQDSFFVRFIHYPPQKKAGESTAQAHPDQSGFTLHLFESAPGLECLTYEGRWVPMPVSTFETVIIPDMQMQLRSKGILKALWHRVSANEETSKNGRYSAVSFIQFKDTPKYDKDTQGRLQEKPEGFNYSMSLEEFARLFK